MGSGRTEHAEAQIADEGAGGVAASPLAYRPDIDGLRAVAVLGVVLCHAGLGLPGGYVGVDVFFVISGYLITGLICRGLDTGTFSLADFWERRIRRIVPALVVVTAATLLAGWFLLLPDAYAALGRSAAALAMLVSNVQFWRDTGYFAPAAEEKPLLHTWSLAVEEQFYLVVPVVLLLLARARWLRRAAALLAVVAVLSCGLSIYGAFRHPSASFYLLPTRAWELLAGSLLALSPPVRTGVRPWVAGAVGVLGLSLILAPCALYDPNTPFPGIAAIPPVVGTVLLIRLGSFPTGLPMASRCLASRPLVFVGLISYSLYLWHWPVFALARHQSLAPLGVADRLGLIAASLVLAVVSWRFVELPCRARKRLRSRPRVFAAAGLAMTSILLAGLALHRNAGFEGRLPPQGQVLAATGRWDYRYTIELGPNDVPCTLARLGAVDAPTELLVWGDSHAMAILPAIHSLCDEHGIAASVATHSSTAPVVNVYLESRYGLNAEAIPFASAIVEHVRERKLRAVLLAASWTSYFADPGFPAALSQTIEQLRSSGSAVYVLSPTPSFPYNPAKAVAIKCMRGQDPQSVNLKAADHHRRNAPYLSFVPEMAACGAIVLDPMPYFRSGLYGEELTPFDSGGCFFCDEHHLSPYGAKHLKPLFTPLFRTP